MADAKISELTAIDAVVAADLFAVVDDPAGTPTTKKATASQIKDYIISLANTWTATQTITPAANTNALAVTGYSLTGSNAQSLIDLAGTWNTTGTPTAIKLNVTNTASNAASLLINLQAGGTSRFNMRVDGTLTLPTTSVTHVFGSSAAGVQLSAPGSEFIAVVSSANAAHFGAYGVYLNSGIAVSWSSSATTAKSGIDLYLYRDAANTLAQRNGTSAQVHRIYRSFTDSSNYSRLTHTWNTSTAIIHAEGAGTGSDGNIAFNDAALATSATVGYVMIPSCAGAPTGVPADIPTGQVALHFDTTNNKLYVYDGGWLSTAALT